MLGFIATESVTICAVSKTSLPSVLLWYSAIAALVTSLGAWIIFLTGQLYLKFEPAEEEVHPPSVLLVIPANSQGYENRKNPSLQE